jgi:hypothetical protein
MYSIRFPVDELTQQNVAASYELKKRQADALKLLATLFASLAAEAYESKSKGGTGSDGIKWDDISPATKAAKNRRAKRKTGKNRRGGLRNNKEATSTGKKRPTISDSMIGVDTGLQRAAVSPGYGTNADLSNPDAILEFTEVDFTIGYGRPYSKYFDEKRPLFPSVLPPDWETQADEGLTNWAGETLEKVYP